MNEDQTKQQNLLDTTDCLEAVGVFKGWKNFLFVTVICCMLLLQVLFWVVNLELVSAEDETRPPNNTDLPAAENEDKKPAEGLETVRIQLADDANQIQEAANHVAPDSNLPPVDTPLSGAAKPVKTKGDRLPTIKFKHLAWLIRLLNFVLILAAVLYCLTMLFCLKVSLLGRLGGINHISRAFFLSLLMLVLIFPWQKFFFFVDFLAGAVYSPPELLRSHAAAATGRIFGKIFYYWRFTGYWLLALLLLILSQVRSVRWAKATLRRLEII